MYTNKEQNIHTLSLRTSEIGLDILKGQSYYNGQHWGLATTNCKNNDVNPPQQLRDQTRQTHEHTRSEGHEFEDINPPIRDGDGNWILHQKTISL